MGHGIEKALDIRIKHPVHLLPVNPGVESVQRIVLTAPRSESIREAKKILLVDGLQNIHDCLLDDLVLQTKNAEWPLGAVRLRDVCPSGRGRPIAAPVYATNLEANLLDLLDRIKSGRYKAPPVRRTYIPKTDGSRRPLGIPTFEDKLRLRERSSSMKNRKRETCTSGTVR